MKVYILMSGEANEGGSVEAVCKTRAAADREARLYKKKPSSWKWQQEWQQVNNNRWERVIDWLEIQEWPVTK